MKIQFFDFRYIQILLGFFFADVAVLFKDPAFRKPRKQRVIPDRESIVILIDHKPSERIDGGDPPSPDRCSGIQEYSQTNRQIHDNDDCIDGKGDGERH